jgi:hypothetical protein
VAEAYASAPIHHVDVVTGTMLHPNGSIEFEGDEPGGLPTIWV